MQSQNNYPIATHLQDDEIRRMAHHFNISIDEVKERSAMIEMQKEMTRAFMQNKKALKN